MRLATVPPRSCAHWSSESTLPSGGPRAAHCCEYCGAPEAVFNFLFEIEHILPTRRGGLDGETNWALACRSCNLHKSVFIEGLDPETQKAARLFHPRADHWNDHFNLDTTTGSIAGLTDIGRATTNRLQMNSPAQLAARRHWMRLHLFPRS